MISLFLYITAESDGLLTEKSSSQKCSATAVSAFGSITAHMVDGMTIALSQFGDIFVSLYYS